MQGILSGLADLSAGGQGGVYELLRSDGDDGIVHNLRVRRRKRRVQLRQGQVLRVNITDTSQTDISVRLNGHRRVVFGRETEVDRQLIAALDSVALVAILQDGRV